MALTTLVEATLVPHKLSTADSFSTKRYKERYKKETEREKGIICNSSMDRFYISFTVWEQPLKIDCKN